MKLIRTNSAYAELAYKRAILREVITTLLNDYIGANGTRPKKKIICGDVFQEDAEIPIERIMEFVEDLQQDEAQVKLELAKFQFRRADDKDNNKSIKQAPPKKTRARRKASGRGKGKASNGES